MHGVEVFGFDTDILGCPIFLIQNIPEINTLYTRFRHSIHIFIFPFRHLRSITFFTFTHQRQYHTRFMAHIQSLYCKQYPERKELCRTIFRNSKHYSSVRTAIIHIAINFRRCPCRRKILLLHHNHLDFTLQAVFFHQQCTFQFLVIIHWQEINDNLSFTFPVTVYGKSFRYRIGCHGISVKPCYNRLVCFGNYSAVLARQCIFQFGSLTRSFIIIHDTRLVHGQYIVVIFHRLNFVRYGKPHIVCGSRCKCCFKGRLSIRKRSCNMECIMMVPSYQFLLTVLFNQHHPIIKFFALTGQMSANDDTDRVFRAVFAFEHI